MHLKMKCMPFHVRNWAVKFVILKSAFNEIMLWFTARINSLWVFSAVESASWWRFSREKLGCECFIPKSAFDEIMPWFTACINILWVFSAAESAFWWARWVFHVRIWTVKFLILKSFWRNHALSYGAHQHSMSIFCGWITILVNQVGFVCEKLGC